MRRLVLTCLTLAALFTSVAPASAIPNLIPYQGRLTDAAGNPLNGSQSVVFALYNVATAGAALYTETQTVTVSNGLFSVNIGSVTTLPTTLWTQPALFLGIKVGTDAEMTPRQTLGAVAFAERAATSEDAAGFSHRRINGFTGIQSPAASLGSVVLNAPTAGFAYVTAGGYSFVSHVAGDGNEWWLQLSPTAGSVTISAGVNAIRITDAEPSGTYIEPYSVADVFPVVAGNNTFHLNGVKIGGTPNPSSGPFWITAIFIPVQRGTASEPQSLMLPARGEPAATPQSATP